MPWTGGPNGGDGHNPWGPNGGPRPRPRPPGFGPGATPPDFEQLIARAQAWLRGLFPGRGAGGRGFLLLGVLAVAIWLGSGFYRVEPDQQGVVLRFGAFVRATAPGLNYHLPWPIETVELPAVTRVNRVDVGFRPDAANARAQPSGDLPARDVGQESLMLTGDENIIDINFSVFWRISNAPDYLFNTRNPDATVKFAAESVMREVIGRTPIQPALAEARARIESEVMRGTQAILTQYQAGVEITQVQLLRVDPPAAVIDSFRDVQRATTDAERLRNEAESYRNDIVPRARGDAARVVAEADAQRQASIAEATGRAQRFDAVLTAYDAAKDITLKRLYIETMQSILSRTPTVIVDENVKNLVPFLPLNEPGKPAPMPPVPAAPPAAGGTARGASR